MNKVLYHLVRLLAKYTSPFISLVERVIAVENNPAKKHPIFIVGAPRTGSTLLYQLITNSNEVLYINNFINLFHRNLPSGFLLDELLFKNEPHNSFSSDLGNTLKNGWRAPSESGNFWYKWLDKANNYSSNNNLPEKKVAKLRSLFNGIMNRYDKPLVFKNLNNSQRLPLIHKIDQKSKIIWIKREPQYVAQSMIIARRRLNVKANEVWSVKPEGIQPEHYNDEYELVVNQINLIEKQIEKDLQLFTPENILVVNYTSMLHDLKKIRQFCGIISEPSEEIINKIKLTNKKLLGTEEWAKLKQEIEKLSWQ